MKKLILVVLIFATLNIHAKAQTSIDSVVNIYVNRAVAAASTITNYDSNYFTNTGTPQNQNITGGALLINAVSVSNKASTDAANAVTQATAANVTLAQLTARVVVVEGKLPAMQTTINTQATQIATLTTQLNAATAANTNLASQITALTARLNAATVTLKL